MRLLSPWIFSDVFCRVDVRYAGDCLVLTLIKLSLILGMLSWVNSAQDRNYWRALVNAALNLRVP